MPDGSGLLVDVALSTKKLEADADRVVAKMTKSGERIDSAWINATRGIDDSFKKAGASASVFEREIAKTDRQVENLRKSVDPLFAATRRLEGQERLLNRALKAGQIDLKVYESTLELVRAEYNLAAGAAQRMAGGVQTLTTVTRGGAGGIQNVAFQVGDFATQVGAGTAASVALGQQLPQLLGGFGALGAVLGAVVAVGVPLGASLLRAGDDATEVSDAMSELAAAVNAYTAAAENTLIPTEELAEKYGRATAAAETFAAALLGISEVQVGEALAASATSAGEAFEGAFTILDRLGILLLQGEEGSRAWRREIQDLNDEYGLTVEQAERLRVATEGLAVADGTTETLAAAQNLQNLLLEVFGTYEAMTGPAREVFEQTVQVGEAAAEVQGTVERVKVQFSDVVAIVSGVVSGLGAATAEADSLGNSAARAAQNLFIAARNLAIARNEVALRGPGDAVEDVRQQFAPNGLRREDIVSQQTFSATAPRASRSGSRGGALSNEAREAQQERNRLEQEGARVVSDLRSETERYQQELQRLAEIERAGFLTTEQLTAAQAKLTAEFEQSQWEQTGLDGFVDALADAIVNAENLGDVFVEQIRRMSASILSSGLTTLGQTLSQNFGGGFGSIFSFGGLPSFNGGGSTGTGARIGGVDGQGGFHAILHPNEVVTDLTRGGGVGGVAITVDVKGANGNREIMAMVEAGVSSGLAQYDANLSGRVRKIDSDPYRR